MKKKLLSILLSLAMVITMMPMATMTAFATGTTYAITNGTPENAKETNHGYIAIDKATAAEGETVTITVNPATGYQLKSLTATPVVPTISTIADVLATVEGFPKDIIENSSPTAPSDAWTNGTGSAFTYKNLALVLKSSSYMYAQLTTGVTFDATNKCYTATVSTLGTLKFNMTDGVLTSFEYTRNTEDNYAGTYAPASTPSAKLKPITPAKQTDGTYQFTMPDYAITVTAEFEVLSPHIHGEGDDAVSFTNEIKTFANLQDLFTNGGSGYLAADITLTETGSLTVAEGVSVNLCLNDKVIDLNKKGNIIVSSGAEFNLYDCGTGTTRYYDKDATTGLWTLNTALMSGDCSTIGGVITGGTGYDVDSDGDTYGGGVYVAPGTNRNDNPGGSFTMYDGNIAGNGVNHRGGGIYVDEYGTIEMHGGDIVGNIAIYQGYEHGGGIYLDEYTQFTMKDGNIAYNCTDDMGGGVYNDFNSIFTMNGGTISGNSAVWGGGGVVNNASFTMNDGEICDNTNSGDGSGGGVDNYGTFTMNGGEITGNTAQWGGGISTDNNSIFTMYSGVITNNSARSGGGLYVKGTANLTANSGKAITITGNHAKKTDQNSGFYGGITGYGTLNLSGKVIIKDNDCNDNYSDIPYAQNLGIETPLNINGALTGSEIYITCIESYDDTHVAGVLTSGYTEKCGDTGLNDFFHYDGPSTFYMALESDELTVKEVPAGSYAISIPSIVGGVVTADKQIAPKDETVTLTVTPDEGYQFKEGTLKANGGDVTITSNKFTMPEASVTVTAEFAAEHPKTDHGDWTPISNFDDLKDLFQKGGSGYLTKNIECDDALTIAKGKTVNLCLDDKVLNLNGKGNIMVSEGAEFNLYDCGKTKRYYSKGTKGLWTLADQGSATEGCTTIGGIITDGTGYEMWSCTYGGAVFGDDDSSFTLYGGNIVGNSADGGGGVYFNRYCKFTMNGGNIIGNTAIADSGGGVYADGEFTMTSGKIANNMAAYNGGGIESNEKITITGGEISGNTCGENQKGGGIDNCITLTLGGTAVIKNNYAKNSNCPCDVENYFDDSVIAIASGDDAPQNGMSVGLYGEGIKVTNASEGDKQYFFANEEGWDVKYNNDDSTLTLAKKSYTVTFDVEGIYAQTVEHGDKVTKPDAPTKEGYTFGGWYSDEACTQAWNFAADTVTENITLHAKWIKNAVQKAAISGNVTEEGKGSVPGAKVELYLGANKIAADVTDGSGNYNFDNVENGTYNIVVTKADGKTKTEMVTINDSSATVNVVLPVSEINSKVEHKGNEVPDAKSDISKTVVGDLDKVADNYPPENDGDKVTIKLTVEPKADTGTAAQQSIKEEAGEVKKIEFLDLSLLKQTNDETPVNIGDQNDVLLTIVIPFDFTNVDVTSVMILRNHGGKSEKLTESANDAGEYVEINEEAGNITLHVTKFSDYAIAFNTMDDEDEYTVTFTQPNHGKIEVEAGGNAITTGTRVAKDTEVEVKATPNFGYRLDSLKANGKSIKTSKKFTMPDKDVTITATFRPVVIPIPIIDPTPGQTDKEKFESYKTLQKIECDKLITITDSEEVKNLVTDAKTAIDNTQYNSKKSLAENKSVVDSIVAQLKSDIDQVRADEATTALAKASKVNLIKATPYKNGKIKLTFKNLKLENGVKVVNYQVYRSTSKKFNKSLKKYNIKRTADTKNYTWTNAKKLKKGTKYYYKVRGKVQLSNGTYVYTKWSNVKSTKCKKTVK